MARAVRGHILVDSALSAIITGQTFPAAIQSEAPSGEPNTTTDQATKSTSEKEPCEHQPVTDNNLQEPLILYDQIVAGEVTVAATVCSEHTFPAAIQSELSFQWRTEHHDRPCRPQRVPVRRSRVNTNL